MGLRAQSVEVGRGSTWRKVRPGRRVTSKKLSEVTKIMCPGRRQAGVPGPMASARSWSHQTGGLRVGGAGLHLEDAGPRRCRGPSTTPIRSLRVSWSGLFWSGEGRQKGARVQRREERRRAQTARDEALGEGGTPGLLAAEGFRENGHTPMASRVVKVGMS